MSGAWNAERIPALDGLRGIAILLVVPHNANLFTGVRDWTFPLGILASVGWTGVQLFLVLSGFLITGVLLDGRGRPDYFRAFYARRILRIFPLYFLALIVFLLILPRLVQLDPETLASYSQQGWLWVFLSNWTQPFHGTVRWFPHFWSLAVEEQFYLVWPLVVALVPARHLLSATLLTVALAVAARAGLHGAGVRADAIYMFTVTRMDALALGAAAAILVRRADVRGWLCERPFSLAGVGLAIALFAAILTRAFNTSSTGTILFGYTLLALAATLLLLALYASHGTGNALDRLFSQRALRACGKYSYAMYVGHMLLIQLLGLKLAALLAPAGSLQPVLYALAFVVLSYVFGWLSYNFFERHFLALKRHFEIRHRTG